MSKDFKCNYLVTSLLTSPHSILILSLLAVKFRNPVTGFVLNPKMGKITTSSTSVMITNLPSWLCRSSDPSKQVNEQSRIALSSASNLEKTLKELRVAVFLLILAMHKITFKPKET